MQAQNEQKDTFELALEEKVEALLQCQKQNELKSCSDCEKFFDCLTRKEYVDACYNSMSKGSSGGFDF
ncbi:MAG: hypothetical protein LUC34_04690 [Campylobacter sp.]|nr:hypothetical protein [Campylobacter sp.]